MIFYKYDEIEIISNINYLLSKRFFAKSIESIRYTSIRRPRADYLASNLLQNRKF